MTSSQRFNRVTLWRYSVTHKTTTTKSLFLLYNVFALWRRVTFTTSHCDAASRSRDLDGVVVVSSPGSSVGRQFDQSALVVSHHSLSDLAKDEEKDETADDQGCHLPPGL
jgi:hypothetical protein